MTRLTPHPNAADALPHPEVVSRRRTAPSNARLTGLLATAALLATVLVAGLIAGAGTATASSHASGETVEAYGETFASTAHIDGADGVENVPLRGTGQLLYRVFFRVYVGALYAPEDVALADIATADRPKRLELAYRYDIAASDIIRGGREMLARQNDEATLAQLADRLDQIDAAYTDVAVGDRYALDYHPDVGTTLRKNGEPVVTIEGRDFADAYFAIWLHPDRPLSRGFRDELLGR